MDHLGSEYAILLHEKELREGLMRGARRARGPSRTAKGPLELRRRLAGALHAAASWIGPEPSAVGPRPAPGGAMR